MQKFQLFSLLILNCIFSYSQLETKRNKGVAINYEVDRSRTKGKAGAPGNYELVMSVNKAQVNKGDSFFVEVFLTGYGQIEHSKILMSTSTSEIFDKIIVKHSLGGVIRDGKQSIFWGNLINQNNKFPAILMLNTGVSFTEKDTLVRYDGYSDFSKDTIENQILTEERMINPPISFQVFIKDKARADNYKLSLYLTYYNGNEWKSSISTLDFRINTWTQKNENLITVVATFAAIFGILPIFISAWRYAFKKRKTKKLSKEKVRKKFNIY